MSVVQTTSAGCVFITLFSGLPCMPTVVVTFNSKTKDETYLVGIRYVAEDGTETIESRYPVSGDAAWFYFHADVRMLSATVASLKTNEVGIWVSPNVAPTGTR